MEDARKIPRYARFLKNLLAVVSKMRKQNIKMEIFDRLAHITKHGWQDQANYWLLEGGMLSGVGGIYMRLSGWPVPRRVLLGRVYGDSSSIV